MDIKYQFLDSENIKNSYVSDIQTLLNQLYPNASKISKKDLEDVASKSNVVAAFDKARIIGVGILCPIRTFTRKKSHIEEVVVDENYRGKNIGVEISKKLIEKAKELELDTIELSSSPKRVAANNLYKKLGFKIRDTNFFELNLN